VAHRLRGNALRKTFNRRLIFEDVSFEIASGQVLLITGRNGSGKSTLVKILCGVLSPARGEVELLRNGTPLADRARRDAIGLVSPYLQLYDEFSARENLELASSLRGIWPDRDRITALLDRVGLPAQRVDPVRTYSSGMKQRAKLAFALVHRPNVLVLDEPMANLDADGIGIVRAVMDEHRRDGILVVATNDRTDIDHPDQEVALHASH
jgi:heme exporter protein A